MRKIELRDIIKGYDHYLPNVDWDKVQTADEATRNELLLEAADQLFSRGRYCSASEYTLEGLKRPDIAQLFTDLKAIDSLTPDERLRLRFYNELKDFCLPLFERRALDLSEAPFGLDNGDFSILNRDLVDWIETTPCRRLAAVVVDVLKEVFIDSEMCTPVAQNHLVNTFETYLKDHYCAPQEKAAERLEKGIEKVTDLLYEAVNHMEVGRRLGFNHIAQGVYDSMDGFIYGTYLFAQVDAAKDFGKWIDDNWPIGERFPTHEQVERLHEKYKEVLATYQLNLIDTGQSFRSILYDVLGASLFSKEDMLDPDLLDDDEWDF